MIAALIFMPLIGLGYWLIYRDVRFPRVTTTVAAPDQRVDPRRGCWTALDERQVVRLLTESAP